MLMTLIHVHVKPEQIAAFKLATVENARQSVQEPGIARFDVIQHVDDPTRFVLIEVYRTDDAPARHKETGHYKTWREAVAPMMAEPRASLHCRTVFPDDREW